MLANIIVRNLVSCILAMMKSYMEPCSEIEVDHLLHDEHAEGHPRGAADQHHSSEVRGPKQLDVVGACDPNERAYDNRQAADDRGDQADDESSS